MAKQLTLDNKTGNYTGLHVRAKTVEEEITDLHQGISGLLADSLGKAIRIGELLAMEKSKHEHGEFIPWIRERLPFDERMAQKYMRLYSKREALANTNPGSYLPINRLLSSVKEREVKSGESAVKEHESEKEKRNSTEKSREDISTEDITNLIKRRIRELDEDIRLERHPDYYGARARREEMESLLVAIDQREGKLHGITTGA